MVALRTDWTNERFIKWKKISFSFYIEWISGSHLVINSVGKISCWSEVTFGIRVKKFSCEMFAIIWGKNV